MKKLLMLLPCVTLLGSTLNAANMSEWTSAPRKMNTRNMQKHFNSCCDEGSEWGTNNDAGRKLKEEHKRLILERQNQSKTELESLFAKFKSAYSKVVSNPNLSHENVKNISAIIDVLVSSASSISSTENLEYELTYMHKDNDDAANLKIILHFDKIDFSILSASKKIDEVLKRR